MWSSKRTVIYGIWSRCKLDPIKTNRFQMSGTKKIIPSLYLRNHLSIRFSAFRFVFFLARWMVPGGTCTFFICLYTSKMESSTLSRRYNEHFCKKSKSPGRFCFGTDKNGRIKERNGGRVLWNGLAKSNAD